MDAGDRDAGVRFFSGETRAGIDVQIIPGDHFDMGGASYLFAQLQNLRQMTVAELIEKLRAMPQDMPVVTGFWSTGYNDIHIAENFVNFEEGTMRGRYSPSLQKEGPGVALAVVISAR